MDFINPFLILLLGKGLIKFEGLWDLIMLLFVGLGPADVITKSKSKSVRRIVNDYRSHAIILIVEVIHSESGCAQRKRTVENLKD